MADLDDFDLDRPKKPGEDSASAPELEREDEASFGRDALERPDDTPDAREPGEPEPGTQSSRPAVAGLPDEAGFGRDALDPPDGTPAEHEPPLPEREPFPVGLAVAAGVMVLAVAGLGYVLWRPAPAPQATPPPAAAATSQAATPAPTPEASPSPEPQPIELPPLDESDALVRELAQGLSTHAQLAAWLGSGDLVRRFTAVAANVASRENPRVHLLFLAPKEKFRVQVRGGRVVADPRNSARYDALADGFAALDAQGCARVYRLVAPLVDAAARELGRPPGSFDATLRDAAAALLAVPVLDEDVPLRPITRAVVLYEYADPRLEALSAPQKQLLRMGPGNVRKVQAKLRELAGALGLDATPAR